MKDILSKIVATVSVIMGIINLVLYFLWPCPKDNACLVIGSYCLIVSYLLFREY